MVDKLIDIFIYSTNYHDAGINSRMIYALKDNLSQDQVLKIIEGSLENNQILFSFNAKPIVKAIIRIHRDKIPMKLWSELLKKNLDEIAISIRKKFQENGMDITSHALKFISSLDHHWKKIPLIIKQISFSPNFEGLITLKGLEDITDKDIQAGLKSTSSQ